MNTPPETDSPNAPDAEDHVVETPADGTVIHGWTGWNPGKVALAMVVVASFGLWIYAYSGFADRTPPDTFDDSTFAVKAEPICAAAKARYLLIPNALAADDQYERATQIRQANVILDDMLTQLEAEAKAMPGTERDRGIAALWLDRWRILLGDRADFAERVAQDPAAMFYISEEAGFRAEKSIDYVANTNDMPSCTLPSDVG